MVVLTEEFHGLSLKRKGAHEAGLFDDAGADDPGSGLPLSWRATKMRRIACPDRDAPAVGSAAAVTATCRDDVAMGDAAAPSPSPGAAGDDEKAMVVYGDGAASLRLDDAPRLALALRGGVGADWIRAMLREADSRTVWELLARAALHRGSESDLALAVVPWVAPTSSPAEDGAEASTPDEPTAGGDDSEGAAAMDFEVDEQQGRAWPWIGQAHGDAAGEGFVYRRWPQHCWAPPQVPAVTQVSPVMWSW